jgi:peptide/nickel transport system substrate-binding protein
MREYKPGSHIILERNRHYWKRDQGGQPLPYLNSIRLDIQQNRELEYLRFRRGQIDLINSLDGELYQRLMSEAPGNARDSGPGLDAELLWFNQAASAPIAPYKKSWFRSTDFRRAVAEAINRDDLCRLVYRGYARPAAGPVSPANQFWFNNSLKPYPVDPQSAIRRLNRSGFRLEAGALRDREGNAVEFSLVTNAGNKTRERMAALIQQDLARIGIRVTLATLDMPSLLERMSRTFNYDACLLGFVNIGLDPNEQMNVWLSTSSNHQWNPRQPSPETPWEAEIDRLMRAQASMADREKRKKLFDRVQTIVWEQAPFIYLVHKNVLSAVAPAVRSAAPGVLRPQTFWNIDRLAVTVDVSRASR